MSQRLISDSTVGNGVVNPDSEFAIALAAAGLTQKEFRDLVFRLSGKRIDATTTSRWAAGGAAPPLALALLRLISVLSPARLAELLKDVPPRI